MEKTIQWIEKLVNIPSPTGYTIKAEAFILDALKEMGIKTTQSTKGTIFAHLNPDVQGDGILFSAHVDTLGLMVRAIKGNGRLRVTTLGGWPLNYAEQECVHVHTRDGKDYEGTLRLNEPAVHASREVNEAKRNDEIMEVVLDEITNCEDDTKKLGIQAGDPISLEARFRQAGDGFIKSRHLDDKASAGLLLTLAEKFAKGEITCARPVYLLFSVYEEIGHGASAGHPEGVTDMIAVDMGVVGDDLKTDETKVSICAKDSSGPYSYTLTDELVKLAQNEKLDYAIDIYPYYGSDASAAMSAGYDYRHALIGPGVAASHGYERTHVKGLENTYKLIEAFLQAQK